MVTVIGGSNCDAEQGAALHRNFPFVDFTVRGEGEGVFPRLLTALQNGGDLADLPGLCWRNSDCASVVNPMSGQPLPPGQIVAPDYEGYIERLKRSRAASSARPSWWSKAPAGAGGVRSTTCAFCGLNGSFMQFRSKRPEVFVCEVLDLVARHRVLDLYVVDNILDMAYLRSALPALAEAGHDLRMFDEIKSNLRRDQLAVLTRWRALGLTFEDDNRVIQVAAQAVNNELLRLLYASGAERKRALTHSLDEERHGADALA